MTCCAFPFDFTCSEEALHSLDGKLLADFSAVANCFMAATGKRLTITSARRTLQHTAALMADFTIPQLEGMYCRNGYPSYIKEMVNMLHKMGRKLTQQEVFQILKNRKEGYISSHLYGAAVDIGTTGLPYTAFLCSILETFSFKTLNENNLGIPCLHVSHTRIKPVIITK